MANRSYLFLRNKLTHQVSSIGEFNYNLPLAFCALCSDRLQIAKSALFIDEQTNENLPLAIRAEFQGGWQNLLKTLKVFQSQGFMQDADYQALYNASIDFFSPYLEHPENYETWLECGELFMMDEEELEIQCADLCSSLQNYDELLKDDLQDFKRCTAEEGYSKAIAYLGFEWSSVLFYQIDKIE